MIVSVYAVLDTKIGSFMAPFTAHNDPQVSRLFGDAVADKASVFSKHPSDFSLFCVGSFDDQVGILVSISPHRFVCSANQFVLPSSSEE